MKLCETCVYFEPSELTENIETDFDGYCHRNPPQVTAWPETHELGSSFPAANREDWCGEWTNDSEGVGL